MVVFFTAGDKDKEALFNVAYNVTDIINNIFNRYLPALLYLPSTTPFMRASAKELLVPFFTPLVWYDDARELLVPFFTPLVWYGSGIRTHDLPLRKRTLYQLSYRGCPYDDGRFRYDDQQMIALVRKFPFAFAGILVCPQL